LPYTFSALTDAIRTVGRLLNSKQYTPSEPRVTIDEVIPDERLGTTEPSDST
jgi:hypothetical protein